MLRDLRIFRRNPSTEKTAVGNNENLPVDPSDSSTGQVELDSSRAPLHTIQEPVLNPNLGSDQGTFFRRKPETTPSRNQVKGCDSSQFRTPEKPAARNRFGWIPKSEPGANATDNGEDLSYQVPNQLPPLSRGTYLGVGGGYGASTPRTYRTAGKASSVHSDSSSTQSTPTKSVTKPLHSGLSSSRPPSGVGTRAASFGMASRAVPVSSAPTIAIGSAEVPHFELKEDPSFWMDHNVQAVIRVRPLNNTERSLQGFHRCLKQESAHSITWIGQPESRFTFDYVACETINQETLFRVAGLPMVENCMSGYNSCIFAYGQTGSGKTYTMLGEIGELEMSPSPDRGMTPRIFEFLFARIKAEEESRRDEKLRYNCKCSFLEIYNEQITDLLEPSSCNLLLREDIRKGVYVENLSEYVVENVGDILKLLIQGAANRKVAATNMNRESSRSHSVFTCAIESKWEKDSSTNLRFARLNLVDLAGSERQKTSGAEGERLKEAANINKSLSTLGHVIMVLADVAHGKQRHVPYRDSRLTFLLQDSLGGNSKTMIIANVSPSICSANETLSTLKFAQRARLIENNAVVNEDATGDVITLQHQIRLLKEEMSLLKRQNISRSLSFTAILEDSEMDLCDISPTQELPESTANYQQAGAAFSNVKVTTKQLKSLEAILAGALRREKMADNTIKQLEAEIEQLNRLVRQREEDMRCSKMMLKFREDKVHRMENLLNGLVPTDSYLLEEKNALSEETKLLRARLDRNPEVTRFALENIRLLDQLRRFQDFYEEGERELLLTEVSDLRDKLLQVLEGKSETDQQLKSDTQMPDDSGFVSSTGENELLSVQLEKTSQELECCRRDLMSCLEINERLTSEIKELHFELNKIRSSNHVYNANPAHQNTELFPEQSGIEIQACKKVECSRQDTVQHAEEILNLQLELDILKTFLEEEKSSHTEIEERASRANNELKVANEMVLNLTKQHEDINNELKEARSIIEALEHEHIRSINELEEVRERSNLNIELLKKQEQEISALRGQLGVQLIGAEKLSSSQVELKDVPRKHYLKEDSPLNRKLRNMQASLEKARDLNMRYQSDQVSQTSIEEEMVEVRRQVEVETAEVIVCLQEELAALQRQSDDSKYNEFIAKQHMMELEADLREAKEKLYLISNENQSLSEVLEAKSRDLQAMVENWERLTFDIADILAEGNISLEEASDQVASISDSFSQRSWISEQVGKMIKSLSEKDLLIEELHKCLYETQNVKSDMEWKLRSLRGATLAITEAQQQESSDKERKIFQLTSELMEKTNYISELEQRIKINEEHIKKAEVRATVALMTVNRLSEMRMAHLQELKQASSVLYNSKEVILQKDALLQQQTSLCADADQTLNLQLEQSQKLISGLNELSQKQGGKQELEEMKKKEESTALSMIAEDILKAKGLIKEFEIGMNALNCSMTDSTEQVNNPEDMQNIGKYSTESAEDDSGERSKTESTQVFLNDNEDDASMAASTRGEYLLQGSYVSSLTLLVKKELGSTVSSLQGINDQMVQLLKQKEELRQTKTLSHAYTEQLAVEVLQMKSEISDKEKQLTVKMQQLENKLQRVDENTNQHTTSWHKTKEALEIEITDAKAIAAQKTVEASNLLAKFEEAQETMQDADSMVKALVQANETAKLDIERLQNIISSLNLERSNLIMELTQMHLSLDAKEQEYIFMEKNFNSNRTAVRVLVLELEESYRQLENDFAKKMESLSCDLDWLKSWLQQYTESMRTWLEETWSGIIGKDCAVSVLHLCHMGILIERITGLNVENGFLQHGLSKSNSLITDLSENNARAKKELEICSILKGKLLVDINNSFNRIANKEDETAEFRERLNSFEKKISHLQLQEESMLARSNIMGMELAVLVRELEANNRNALAAVSIQQRLSREKEELSQELEDTSRLLDEVQTTNEVFLCSLSEELVLLVDDVCPGSHLKADSSLRNSMGLPIQFESYQKLIKYQTESIMINLFAKDIEFLVVVSELDQNAKRYAQMASQIADLKRQGGISCSIIEETKLELIGSKIDSDLQHEVIQSLLSEIEELRNDLMMQREDHFQVVEELQKMKMQYASSISHEYAMNEKNQTLQDRISDLESSITRLQTVLDTKQSELEQILYTHSEISKELGIKSEISDIQIGRIKALKSENESLESKVRELMAEKDKAIEMLGSVLDHGFDLDQLMDMVLNAKFNDFDSQFALLVDRMHQESFENSSIASKFFSEMDFLELSSKKLMSKVSSLQSELMHKDDMVKGLLFDLSLLQESASVAKDQKDELKEMAATLDSLEDELESRSYELNEVIAHRKMLEAELLEKNNKISSLESEFDEKFCTLHLVSAENLELKAHMEQIMEMKSALEEELKVKTSITERLEEKLLDMSTLLGQRNSVIEDLQNEITKLTDERDMAQSLAEENEAIATEARQIAEGNKAYAEEKEEEVKLLERSIHELEYTVYALENKMDFVKAEAERQQLQREELEMELEAVRNQMLAVPVSGNMSTTKGDKADLSRHLEGKKTELEVVQKNVEVLEKEIEEKNTEIVQLKAHISELNTHAEAQAKEYIQKFKELETMAQQVKADPASSNATSLTSAKPEKCAGKSRGSGSPFKCIGIGFVQHMSNEKDEELITARHKIEELESLAASRQKEIFMLKTRLAAAESMTHDVIRDMLGVKLDMTNYASLIHHDMVKEKDTVQVDNHASQEKEKEVVKMKKQLNELLQERKSWLDELNEKQKELVAVRIMAEKLRQQNQFLSTEKEMLKLENSNYKKMIVELEDKAKKLSSQQNLQQRIHHHAKTKEENSFLKTQNEDLNTRLKRSEEILSRVKEELAFYRSSCGKDPFIDFDKEEQLRKQLQESEADSMQSTKKLLNMCATILKIAGLTETTWNITPSAAEDAVHQLKDHINLLENELEDLRLKCKILHEKIRLEELGYE